MSIECCADTLSGPLLLYKSRGCPAFTIWSNGQTGIRQIVQDILEEGPFGHLLVLMDGATTTEAAPPFAIFEGWVLRTMASVLGGQYLSLHVL